MTLKEQYENLRPSISDGDLVLFAGTGFVARVIENSDHSQFSHIGVVIESHGALYIVDSNAPGVQADRLSQRVDSYHKGAKMAIIKPLVNKEELNWELRRLLKKSDSKLIKYDFKNGIKELINRKFGTRLRITQDENRDICSDYVSRYAINLSAVTSEFESLRIAFPQDFIRYRSIERTKLLV